MIYNLLISILFIIPLELQSQDWKKIIKIEGKKALKGVENKIKNEVKPLTIDFKVKKVDYNPIKSLDKLNLVIEFSGNNPNPLGVTFNRTEFDLFVNDEKVAKFYNEKKIKIPKKDEFSFKEQAQISILEAGKTIFNSIVKKKAVYTVIGTYYIDSPFGTFSFKTKLIEKEVNKKKKKSKK